MLVRDWVVELRRPVCLSKSSTVRPSILAAIFIRTLLRSWVVLVKTLTSQLFYSEMDLLNRDLGTEPLSWSICITFD